jgi:predicted DNA-binding transcriptional regulator YafY
MLRGRTSSVDLAEEFGVSVRTIMRDISILSTSRAIGTSVGKGGGIYLVDGPKQNKPCLKSEEIALLKNIISQCEMCQHCQLCSSDVQLLKDMVTVYS